ncbi:MAG: hypothetical protein NT069_20030 [Planctomycetota bacterium]|nr:hypothetical protein [Planctomycetota bacterium]
MRRVCLFVERLSLVGWLGMGIMFLALLLALRGSPLFSTETKDNHPRVLFPAYYTLEFTLLGMAAVSGLVRFLAARGNDRCGPATVNATKNGDTQNPLSGGRRRGATVTWVVTLFALGLAVGEYLVVYQPLAAMLGRPPYPQQFQLLHEMSRWINTAILLLTAVGATRSLWCVDVAPGDES